ncbi:MAG: RAMP superfamily CRISPR-associated protein [Bacillota bacterium]
MTVRLVFSLHMLSDYHTAAGYGYGQTMDSALLKDDKGLPIIRGSSLSGLFRSAAKELTSAMGQYGERLIDSIFGNAGQKGQWAFGAARLAASARHMPLTQIRQGVRIDPALRRAQDKKLYALEVGSAGLTFEFDIEQLTPNETELDEAAVLVAAARLVRGLGAQVNRGAGRCLITLKAVTGHTGNLDQDGLLQHLGLVVKGAARKMQFDRQVAEPITPDGLSLSFRVLARNLEPLMISRQNHPGNGYDSLDYIPGNVFLGALASHYLAAGLAADQQFLELFRYGGVRVSPLYPAMVSGGRQLSPTIPIPADMLTCKRQGHFSTSPHSTDLEAMQRRTIYRRRAHSAKLLHRWSAPAVSWPWPRASQECRLDILHRRTLPCVPEKDTGLTNRCIATRLWILASILLGNFVLPIRRPQRGCLASSDRKAQITSYH